MIHMGKGSYVGSYSYILLQNPDSNIRIGRNCSISSFFSIVTGNRVADQDFERAGGTSSPSVKHTIGEVVIKDNVWIATKVSIVDYVTIHENAVIGAHSVVSRDIPPHSIADGVPAKVVKFKSHLSDDEVEKLATEFYESPSDELKEKYDDKR